ncbi:hypothetical protein Tco_0403202 [Tanacetum coccineum]
MKSSNYRSEKEIDDIKTPLDVCSPSYWEVRDWWLQLLVVGDDKEFVVIGEVGGVLFGRGDGGDGGRL